MINMPSGVLSLLTWQTRSVTTILGDILVDGYGLQSDADCRIAIRGLNQRCYMATDRSVELCAMNMAPPVLANDPMTYAYFMPG
jgi:hypothetical protein